MKRGRTKRGLTLEELKMAALICFRNADEILEDAESLYSHKRYARTVFLSCIGMEELGKSTLCLELFEANWQFDTDGKIKKFWMAKSSTLPSRFKRLCIVKNYNSMRIIDNYIRINL